MSARISYPAIHIMSITRKIDYLINILTTFDFMLSKLHFYSLLGRFKLNIFFPFYQLKYTGNNLFSVHQDIEMH